MQKVTTVAYKTTASIWPNSTLLHAAREQLDTALHGLSQAQIRAPAEYMSLVNDYFAKYRELDVIYNELKKQESPQRKEVVDIHKNALTFRRSIMTDSNKLKIAGVISSNVFHTLPPPAPTPQAPATYVARPIISPAVTPAVARQGGYAGPPAAPTHQGHIPRRSQSMSFSASMSFAPILEESAPTPLTSPHRPRPAHQAFHAPSPSVSSSSGAAHYVPPSHGHSLSISSAHTFGHAQNALPRQSTESDQSYGSSTGDISVYQQGQLQRQQHAQPSHRYY